MKNFCLTTLFILGSLILFGQDASGAEITPTKQLLELNGDFKFSHNGIEHVVHFSKANNTYKELNELGEVIGHGIYSHANTLSLTPMSSLANCLINSLLSIKIIERSETHIIVEAKSKSKETATITLIKI